MNIIDQVKTYADICKIDGVDPVTSLPFPEATTEEEKAINSVAKVFRINRVLNDGWKPDWTDYYQYKYYPWFDMNAGSGSGFSFNDFSDDCDGSTVGSRLVYKTRELARFAGETFLEEYEGFMVYEK